MTNKEKFLACFPFRYEKDGEAYRFKEADVPNSIMAGMIHYFPRGHQGLVLEISENGFFSSSTIGGYHNSFFEFDQLIFREMTNKDKFLMGHPFESNKGSRLLMYVPGRGYVGYEATYKLYVFRVDNLTDETVTLVGKMFNQPISIKVVFDDLKFYEQ